MRDITIAFVHYKKREKKNGAYPVKIRIICNREARFYSTGIDLTKTEWPKVFGESPKGSYKDTKKELEAIEDRAQGIIDDMVVFNWSEFAHKFLSKEIADSSLQGLFNEYKDKLMKEDKVGTAQLYQSALNSFLKYSPKFSFNDITPEFPYQYEKWMLSPERKRSLTVVGIYFRHLRTILNIAIERGLMKREQYPFGRRKYIIPSGRNIKKALPVEQIKRIEQYKASNKMEQRAIDYWMFSYYADGLNFKDILLLKKTDIQGEFFVIIRAKTAISARGNQKILKIYIIPEMKAIMKRQGQSNGIYIFPVMEGIKDALAIEKAKDQFIDITNDYISKICENLKMPFRVTTSHARHSKATALKNAGASTSYIKDQWGHASEKTTEFYLDSFNLDYIKEMAKKLRNK